MRASKALSAVGIVEQPEHRQDLHDSSSCGFDLGGKVGHKQPDNHGNLCNDRIKAKMDNILSGFGFEIVEKVENALFNSTF